MQEGDKIPDNIIAQWLNLPNVELSEAVTCNGCTEIYLDRDNSSGYICSNCDDGLDLVVETVGIPTTQVKSLELVRPRGRIVYLGTSHGGVKFSGHQFERIVRREINMTGSWMSYSPPFPGRARTLGAHFLTKRRIKTDILISHRFKLEKIKDAFEAMVNTSIFSEKLIIVF